MKRIIISLLFIFVLNFINGQNDNYQSGYLSIDSMLTDKKATSLKEAVYIVENAYLENKLNFETFEQQLLQYTAFIRSLSTNNLISYNHKDFKSANLHAAIFKMMTDAIPIYISDTTLVYSLPFKYNFEDYDGKKEWSSMFVSTLISTHKGNCHSLPLFYKLLAEELGEKAWIALAPNHAYIKLFNLENGWYNVELTSGQFPTDIWIKASGYIHTNAIRNKLYMDTLSLKSTVAICMTDLAEGYKQKFNSDYNPEFVLKCCKSVLNKFPNYINALLLKAETLLDIYKKTQNKKYYEEMEKVYSDIHQLGYRKMPEKMYLQWLQSLTDKSLNNLKYLH